LRRDVRLHAERIDRHAALLEAFEQLQHASAVIGVAGFPVHIVVIDELRARRRGARRVESKVERGFRTAQRA
jgi:hypothetical protein